MSALIKLTKAENKMDFYIDADIVQVVTKNPSNLMETIVQTSVMSMQGPLMYSVIETPDDVAAMTNRARKGVAVLGDTFGIH